MYVYTSGFSRSSLVIRRENCARHSLRVSWSLDRFMFAHLCAVVDADCQWAMLVLVVGVSANKVGPYVHWQWMMVKN